MKGDFYWQIRSWKFTKNDKLKKCLPNLYLNLPNQLKNCLP